MEASRLQIAGLAGYLAGWLGSAGQKVSGVGGEAVGPAERLQSSIPAGLGAGSQQAADCRPGRLLGCLADQKVSGVGREAVGPIERLQSSIPAGLEAGSQQAAQREC